MNTLFSHITKVTKRKGADTRTLSTLRDCFEKVELYMGHRLRAVNQQRAVSKVLNDMRMRANQGEGLDEAIVTIDFKLNTEPKLS
ncbi:Hypothetical protein PHPALM_12819 [Phytophthora palmivora]|uniref:Uncharacterized protein n=1 Tax=Phytophthora palmivora TaxID=4796 RepID=A0A2P4XYS4_9STRA|nr:Hypothetical protein PHPALM_12819 [Phytophthora palmivora]